MRHFEQMTQRIVLTLTIVFAVSMPTLAANRFMRPVNAGAAAPYTAWATAATNFSHLAAVWQDGDVIWMTNGVYTSTAQTIVDRGVTIKTAGSRDSTIVDGGGWRVFQLQHSNAVVEGITVTNGWSPDDGPAFYVYLDGTIRNCTIAHNSASGNGGGIYLVFGGLVDGCLVIDNQATGGGGIACAYGGTVLNSTVMLNRAASNGGGIDLRYGGTVSNCVIAGNRAGPAGSGGGGVSIYDGGTVVDCLILSNAASYGTFECRGGGVSIYYDGVLSNCTIVGNAITYFGGGVALYQCDSGGVFNCVISNNVATNASSGRGGGIWCSSAGLVVGCEIVNNISSNMGGGVWCDTLAGVISNCTIRGNFAKWQGGGVALFPSGTLLNSTAINNSSAIGGGIYSGNGGRIAGCVISGNDAFGTVSGDGEGGGLYSNGPHVTNCLIVNNTASNQGGGVYWGNAGRFYYCTIAGNTASNAGGVFRAGVGYAFTNCIIFHNYATTVNSNFAFTGNDSTNFFCSSSCTAPPLAGSGFGGNRYEDPLFRNLGAGNYELGTNSPCIDTAGGLAAPYDLKGVRRPLDGNGDGTNSYDMGAYEFVSRFSDSDRDGINDQTETRIGTDPLSNNTDGDDADDNYEHITGTDPTRYTPFSELFHTKMGSAGGGGLIVLNWDSVTGRLYSAVSSTNLLSIWSDTTFTNVTGTGGPMSCTNPATAGSESLTLRIWLTEDP